MTKLEEDLLDEALYWFRRYLELACDIAKLNDILANAEDHIEYLQDKLEPCP